MIRNDGTSATITAEERNVGVAGGAEVDELVGFPGDAHDDGGLRGAIIDDVPVATIRSEEGLAEV